MKTVVSAHTRVRVFFTSCCFSLTLSLNKTARRIKTPMVHIRGDLTTRSTILSHVGILAILSWNFTGNVLSNCRLFDYLIYNFTPQSTGMVMSVRCYRFMEFLPTDIWMSCQARCALNYPSKPLKLYMCEWLDLTTFFWTDTDLLSN